MGIRWVAVSAMLVLGARSAAADRVCVATEHARDRLNPDEQETVRLVFENVLVAAGLGIEAPCDETWTLSHVRLGDSLHVLVVTPRGAFAATSPSFESLGITYEGLVGRVLATRRSPTSIAPSDTPGVDVAGPVAAPAATPGAKGTFYLRVGYGVAPAMTGENASRVGPTIGIGYRRASDAWLFDISAVNTHAWRDESSYDINVLSYGRLAAGYLLLEEAQSTWYAGGGLSFGQSAVRLVPDEMYLSAGTHHGYAVQLEAQLGYELLRHKTVRVFFEAWLTAPLSAIAAPRYTGSEYVTPEYWAPTLNFSTGIGF